MAIWPLKRRRTALSIPLGLRHEGATHLNRSDWWRLKRLVPVTIHVSPSNCAIPIVSNYIVESLLDEHRPSIVEPETVVFECRFIFSLHFVAAIFNPYLPSFSINAVHVVDRSKGDAIQAKGKRERSGFENIRFLTIGMCFLAATILKRKNRQYRDAEIRKMCDSTHFVGVASRRALRVVESERNQSRKLRTGGVGDPH